MGVQRAFELALVHLRAAGDIAPSRLGVQFGLGLLAARPAAVRAAAAGLVAALAFGLVLEGLAAAFLRLGMAQVLGVLLRAFVFRGARLVQRDGHRLLWVFHL